MNDDILIFDIWADYAHFRTYPTTVSPLTFSIPPRTAMCGLISAIIGLDKDEYLKYFSKKQADIAVKILNPIKTTRISQNLIDTENISRMNQIKNSIPTLFEYLKDAKYRIYFRHRDIELYNKTKEFLENHKSVYTPCLGLSENIANFCYIGEKKCKEIITDGFIKIDSAIPEPKYSRINIDIEEEKEYDSELIPIVMNEKRIVEEYNNIFFEKNGLPIIVKVNKFYEIDDEKILFL
jgi:CRISPR-associated protein Cas5h